ncbi:hypothetical protein GQ600_25983 [Phytophthora cactorum]|nr:hypothetical protein GQ600_25983 [Phytophthora cactorum]
MKMLNGCYQTCLSGPYRRPRKQLRGYTLLLSVTLTFDLRFPNNLWKYVKLLHWLIARKWTTTTTGLV